MMTAAAEQACIPVQAISGSDMRLLSGSTDVQTEVTQRCLSGARPRGDQHEIVPAADPNYTFLTSRV